MRLFSVVDTETNEPVVLVPGYYHSEFLNDHLNFTLEFDHVGAGEFCDYSWANYPVEETIEISCNRAISVENKGYESGEKLNDLFLIKKFETDSYFIAFLLEQNQELSTIIEKGFYTFRVRLETESNEVFEDSTILKLQ